MSYNNSIYSSNQRSRGTLQNVCPLFHMSKHQILNNPINNWQTTCQKFDFYVSKYPKSYFALEYEIKTIVTQ